MPAWVVAGGKQQLGGGLEPTLWRSVTPGVVRLTLVEMATSTLAISLLKALQHGSAVVDGTWPTINNRLRKSRWVTGTGSVRSPCRPA
jgi:hypothetical protein